MVSLPLCWLVFFRITGLVTNPQENSGFFLSLNRIAIFESNRNWGQKIVSVSKGVPNKRYCGSTMERSINIYTVSGSQILKEYFAAKDRWAPTYFGDFPNISSKLGFLRGWRSSHLLIFSLQSLNLQQIKVYQYLQEICHIAIHKFLASLIDSPCIVPYVKIARVIKKESSHVLTRAQQEDTIKWKIFIGKPCDIQILAYQTILSFDVTV